MSDSLLSLSCAEKSTDASRDRLAFRAHDVRFADRTPLRKSHWACAVRAPLLYDFHHFGNDVARPPHEDRIADAHILPG